jgi:hypothetical protein
MDSKSKEYKNKWRKEHPKVEKDYTKSGKRAYKNIIQRCTNPNHFSYHNYGARGIKLELSLEEFLDIYFSTSSCAICNVKLNDENRLKADGRTLDRINETLNYTVSNVRVICRACNCSLARKRRRGDLI